MTEQEAPPPEQMVYGPRGESAPFPPLPDPMTSLREVQTESEWQRFVTDYAESLGWDWMHVGRVGKYQANGAKGTLGEGWPDLVLVKGHRVLFVELKAQDGKLTVQQRRVLDILGGDVWRPSDFARMADVLHG